jgi:hypothetical protein
MHLWWLEEDDTLDTYLIFGDKDALHLNGSVKKPCVFLGWKNPHISVEIQYDLSNAKNVHCPLSKTKVYGPFFFTPYGISGMVYLDVLE